MERGRDINDFFANVLPDAPARHINKVVNSILDDSRVTNLESLAELPISILVAHGLPVEAITAIVHIALRARTTGKSLRPGTPTPNNTIQIPIASHNVHPVEEKIQRFDQNHQNRINFDHFVKI